MTKEVNDKFIYFLQEVLENEPSIKNVYVLEGADGHKFLLVEQKEGNTVNVIMG